MAHVFKLLWDGDEAHGAAVETYRGAVGFAGAKQFRYVSRRNMRQVAVLFGFAVVGGCADVPRADCICRVVTEGEFKPIAGAHVHMQPYAPMHPFWPRASDGVTDANGNVTLALPAGFWWYMSKATADGYVPGSGPALNGNDGVFDTFYMRPVTADRPR